MIKDTPASRKIIMQRISQDPKYIGKEIVVIDNEIHILNTRNKTERIKLLTSLTKKYPQSTPMIALIPKENTLILIL